MPEPTALLRTKNIVVLVCNKEQYYFQHFRHPTDEDLTNLRNLSSRYPTKHFVTNKSEPVSYYPFELMNPIHFSSKYFELQIFIMENNPGRGFITCSRQKERKLLTPYLNEIGIALSQKINSIIIERYQTSFLQKVKYILGDSKSILDKIDLSQLVVPIMESKFYDPVKHDPEITVKTVSDITLVFHLHVELK